MCGMGSAGPGRTAFNDLGDLAGGRAPRLRSGWRRRPTPSEPLPPPVEAKPQWLYRDDGHREEGNQPPDPETCLTHFDPCVPSGVEQDRRPDRSGGVEEGRQHDATDEVRYEEQGIEVIDGEDRRREDRGPSWPEIVPEPVEEHCPVEELLTDGCDENAVEHSQT